MDIKRSIKNAQNQLGIKELRKHQVKPINALLSQQDVMVIAQTSAGKSAIYQIPALIFPGMTLVIEPTLSLMYDQVNKLQNKGISACCLNSAMHYNERNSVLERVAKGKVKLLFVTPERLQNQKFLEAIQSIKISMVAIDEAHCVTSWGYSFRAAYLEIGSFIAGLRHRPVIAALTATAAPQMRPEICNLLAMNQPKIFVNSLHRPNLHFMKRSFVSNQAKLRELKHLLKKHKDRFCIVYCNTKEMTDNVYDEVKKWYPDDVVKCHSNVREDVRKTNEMMFLMGHCHIMVATSAFGLGVDQDSVNLVIHFNLPLSLVDYYQQAGRAGRSGQKAKCVLLYCENDYHTNRTLLKKILDRPAQRRALWELDKMKEYADSSECLTQQLLLALGEQMEKSCGSCTNCQKARKLK